LVIIVATRGGLSYQREEDLLVAGLTAKVRR
jgi:hypothetical protein